MPISHIELTIKDRILQVIKHKNIDLRRLAEKYELKHRTLAEQVTTENAKIGCSVIYLIAQEHNDISLEWVMTGRGDMIKPPIQINNHHEVQSLSFRLNSAAPCSMPSHNNSHSDELDKLQSLNEDLKYIVELQRYKITKLTEENEQLKKAK